MLDQIQAMANHKQEMNKWVIPTYTKAILSALEKEKWLTILEINERVKHTVAWVSSILTIQIINDLLLKQFVDLKLIEEYQQTTKLNEKQQVAKIVYKSTEHTHPMLEITRLDKEMVFILKIIYETSCNNGNHSTIETINNWLKGYILKKGTIPEYINQLILTWILDPYQDGVRMSPEYWKYLDIIFKDMKKRN
jgi:hypothetical protein